MSHSGLRMKQTGDRRQRCLFGKKVVGSAWQGEVWRTIGVELVVMVSAWRQSGAEALSCPSSDGLVNHNSHCVLC